MPVRSVAQSRYLNAKFGHAWVKAHGFDQSTKGLPSRVGEVARSAARRRRRRRRHRR